MYEMTLPFATAFLARRVAIRLPKMLASDVEKELSEIYYRYHDSLKKSIPKDRMGNFYKIGYDVLRHHLMAFLNYDKEKGNRAGLNPRRDVISS